MTTLGGSRQVPVNRVVVGVPLRADIKSFSIRQLSPVCKNLDPQPSYSARGRLTIQICSIRTDTGERRRDRECGCNFRNETRAIAAIQSETVGSIHLIGIFGLCGLSSCPGSGGLAPPGPRTISTEIA